MSHVEHSFHKHQKKTIKHVKASNKLHSKSKQHGEKQKKPYSKLKCFCNVESNYLCAKRLTNRIGIFNKGKISDSISRIEKRMPHKVRSQVNQDLNEVLRVSKKNGLKQHQNHKRKHKINSEERSIPRASRFSSYLVNNNDFASNSWEDELQKSVGVNSILASVCKQTEKKSPVLEEVSLARNTLVTQIYPNVCKANFAMFPNVSNKNKVKNKLMQFKTLLDQSFASPQQCCSLSQKCNMTRISPRIALESSIDRSKHTSQSVIDDFELNPIFTGEAMDHNLTEIFPHASSFVELDDNSSASNVESVFLSDSCESGIYSYQAPSTSSSKVNNNSVTLVPSSPTTSENSPSWKLKFSPDIFKPVHIRSPNIYFRHKMF